MSMAYPKPESSSVCVTQEILQSLDRCIELSRKLEAMSFKIHLGEPAKEISSTKEDRPSPDSFSHITVSKISVISETLSTTIKNLDEFISLK